MTVSTPAVPHPVYAWILWEDGVEELVHAHAIAWTKRAVQVRPFKAARDDAAADEHLRPEPGLCGFDHPTPDFSVPVSP